MTSTKHIHPKPSGYPQRVPDFSLSCAALSARVGILWCNLGSRDIRGVGDSGDSGIRFFGQKTVLTTKPSPFRVYMSTASRICLHYERFMLNSSSGLFGERTCPAHERSSYIMINKSYKSGSGCEICVLYSVLEPCQTGSPNICVFKNSNIRKIFKKY